MIPHGPMWGSRMTPIISPATPSAATRGQYDGWGRWIPWPLTRAGSGSFPPFARFVSHSASRPCTTGISAKFHSCGGDGMDHSSVAPFQGSAGAFRGPRHVLMMLYRKIRNEKPRMNEPTVSIRLSVSNPRPSG